MGRPNDKLTEEQRQEIVQRYIESFANPGEKRLTQQQLADEYGVTRQWISRILCDSSTLERVERRTQANVILARAMAQQAAPDVMAETIADALAVREDKLRYINQNACRDVLDRAGVKAKQEDRQEIAVTFDSGSLNFGMPAKQDDAR